MKAIRDFISGFRRGYKRSTAPTIEEVVGPQLRQAMRCGVHDDFQAGYVAALSWTWEQAELPPSAESVGLHAMAAAYRRPIENA